MRRKTSVHGSLWWSFIGTGQRERETRSQVSHEMGRTIMCVALRYDLAPSSLPLLGISACIMFPLDPAIDPPLGPWDPISSASFFLSRAFRIPLHLCFFFTLHSSTIWLPSLQGEEGALVIHPFQSQRRCSGRETGLVSGGDDRALTTGNESCLLSRHALQQAKA